MSTEKNDLVDFERRMALVQGLISDLFPGCGAALFILEPREHQTVVYANVRLDAADDLHLVSRTIDAQLAQGHEPPEQLQ